jgi:L-alanine-DL-glutamate epimerase-like enolase superfamily enzyme
MAHHCPGLIRDQPNGGELQPKEELFSERKGVTIMKITRIETIQIKEFPLLLFLHLYTDEGIIGLGETMFGPDTVAAYIHSQAAPYLLGKNPLEIERHWREIFTLGRAVLSRSAEIRGLSAIDIALWDIFGQVTGQPIYQLLGGKFRERILVYNTCAGYRYGVSATQRSSWAIFSPRPKASMKTWKPFSIAPTNWPKASTAKAFGP